MEIITTTIFLFALISLVYFSEAREVKKFEEKKLEPLIKALYRDPNSNLKHLMFLIKLKKLDFILARYKKDGYLYTPSRRIFGILLNHLEKYPFDFLAHKRFLYILERSQNTVSGIIFKQLLEHIDKYPTNYLVHERFVCLVEKESEISSKIIYKQLLKHIDKYPTNPLVQESLARCAENAYLLPVNLLEPLLNYLDNYPTKPTAHGQFRC
jgi:hypothetical protein